MNRSDEVAQGSATGRVLLRIAEDARLRALVRRSSMGDDVVRRFIAGESLVSALDTLGELLVRGRLVSLTHLAADPLDPAEANDRRRRIRKALRRLGQAGYSHDARVEVSVRLGSLGAAQGPAGQRLAREYARSIAECAAEVGTRLTLETEPGLPVSLILDTVAELREETPDVGVALQAALRRTESDCLALAGRGVRVRLARGAAHGVDAAHGHDRSADVDRAYVRCLEILLAAPAQATIATADLRLHRIAEFLADRDRRDPATYEFQLRYGVHPERQTVVADRGGRMRVYLPFGKDWYAYLASRVAEEPRHLPALLRTVTGR